MMDIRKRKTFSGLLLAGVFIAIYIFSKNLVFSIFLTVCSVLFFSDFFNFVNEKRTELLHDQLIGFVINIIVMLKAGRTIRDIIRQSVNISKNPLKKYLKSLSGELEISASFDEALDNFAFKCSSREANLIVTALKINNKIGGDLVFVLANIIETLQESFKVKSSERTITLQSRYSGNIIAVLPVLILTGMFITAGESTREFFSSRLGNIFLFAGAVLEISGIIFIRKILNFKN